MYNYEDISLVTQFPLTTFVFFERELTILLRCCHVMEKLLLLFFRNKKFKKFSCFNCPTLFCIIFFIFDDSRKLVLVKELCQERGQNRLVCNHASSSLLGERKVEERT